MRELLEAYMVNILMKKWVRLLSGCVRISNKEIVTSLRNLIKC